MRLALETGDEDRLRAMAGVLKEEREKGSGVVGCLSLGRWGPFGERCERVGQKRESEGEGRKGVVVG